MNVRIPKAPLATYLAGLIVLATIGLVIFMVVRQALAVDTIRAQYNDLHTQYEELYEEAVKAGAEPEAPAPEDIPEADTSDPTVELPAPLQGQPGPQGFRGPVGITGEQGVRGLTGARGPVGPQGADGEAGATGKTGSQGATGADGAQGPEGPAGPVGPTGADSTVTGPEGPPGATGDTGQTGAAGRGIRSITCPPSGDWIIEYTDGTADTIAGPCRTNVLGNAG